MSIVIHKGLINAEQNEEKDNTEEDEADETDEGRGKEFLCYRCESNLTPGESSGVG